MILLLNSVLKFLDKMQAAGHQCTSLAGTYHVRKKEVSDSGKTRAEDHREKNATPESLLPEAHQDHF